MEDDFSKNPGPINGRTPAVKAAASNWMTAGTYAGLMTVSGGFLTQTAPGSGGAGYAYIDLGEIPGVIGVNYRFGSGTQPPVIACFKDGLIQQTIFQMLHAYMGMNSIAPQVMDQPVFTDASPAHEFDWNGPASLYANHPVADNSFLVRIDGKWCFFERWSGPFGTGTLISQKQAYHDRLPDVIGQQIFIETFDDQMKYAQVWADKATTIPVKPTLDIRKNTYFPTLDGLKISPYSGNGSPATAPTPVSGKARITMNNAQGSGAAMNVGTINNGNILATTLVGLDAGMTGLASVIAQDAVVAPSSPIVALTQVAQNQYKTSVQASADVPGNALDIIGAAVGGGATRTADLARMFVLVNPPTTFV